MVRHCLTKLVVLKRVSYDQTQVPWYVAFDDVRLAKNKVGGGFSLDSRGIPVIYLPTGASRMGMAERVAHEFVHLAQFMREDYEPLFGGFTEWKSDPYPTLPGDDPDYPKQPWEAEAFALAPVLLEYLRSMVNRARPSDSSP